MRKRCLVILTSNCFRDILVKQGKLSSKTHKAFWSYWKKATGGVERVCVCGPLPPAAPQVNSKRISYYMYSTKERQHFWKITHIVLDSYESWIIKCKSAHESSFSGIETKNIDLFENCLPLWSRPIIIDISRPSPPF